MKMTPTHPSPVKGEGIMMPYPYVSTAKREGIMPQHLDAWTVKGEKRKGKGRFHINFSLNAG
ncbi:MAG: hypothetical protein CO107_01050 [Deltaproteobacteria bacterium CG_4_9_14_3_um_filter_51_14]|nr:MAG: hypothetical protein CO107_01050 [Deltaproteobacteria bacterium CG_4_9_14_3_um_filter_51_14]